MLDKSNLHFLKCASAPRDLMLLGEVPESQAIVRPHDRYGRNVPLRDPKVRRGTFIPPIQLRPNSYDGM